MRDYRKNMLFFKKVSAGMIISLIVPVFVFAFQKNAQGKIVEMLLYEAVPFYSTCTAEVSPKNKNTVDMPEYEVVNAFVADEKALKKMELNKINEDVHLFENSLSGEYSDVIGTNAVLFQPEKDIDVLNPNLAIAPFSENWLSDFEFISNNFYSVAPATKMTTADFDGQRFMNENMKITPGGGPKVLIIHTHMYENFFDSDPDNVRDGVFALGERLAGVLKDKYGISALHYDGRFDVVDGKINIWGAYERMEEKIVKEVLAENPSIEIIIDLHRDGVKENVKLIAEINGENCAPIMFVNGISKIMDKGVLVPIKSLYNPNLPQNLAFSFQMQYAAWELYPGFARKIYINAYRYSLNMLPKSLLVEVGAQTNTKEEALHSIEPLADILAKVVL